MTTVINSWNSVDGGTVSAIAQPEQTAATYASVLSWDKRVQAAHPKSEPEFWPDELRIKYMAVEISELRAAIAQPEQQTDLQQQNQQLRDQNTALDLRCAEYEKAAQAGQSEPVAWMVTPPDDDKYIDHTCALETAVEMEKRGWKVQPLYNHPAPMAQMVDTTLSSNAIITPVYEHPAPVRHPLTEEQATDFYWESPQFDTYKDAFIGGIRAIEAKINAQGGAK